MAFEKHKQKAILKAFVKKLPFIYKIRSLHTRGTDNSRYCYSVWLRHYIYLNLFGALKPKKVAELGPGDSIGVGIAALLFGAEKIYAFDVKNTIDVKQNLLILDELVELIKKKEVIPGNDEFPFLSPSLNDYSFPHSLISNVNIEHALNPTRISEIREEIKQLNKVEFNGKYVYYKAPWETNCSDIYGEIDVILSQAVLEHALNIEKTYEEMFKFLIKGGLMSHQIDFKSHGTSTYWNGHRFYKEKEWKFVNDVEGPAINRTTFLDHINISENIGFITKMKKLVKREDGLSYDYFKNKNPESKITFEEFITSGMFIVSEKQSNVIF